MLTDKSVTEPKKWLRRERAAADLMSKERCDGQNLYHGMAIALMGVQTKIASLLREQQRQERKGECHDDTDSHQ